MLLWSADHCEGQGAKQAKAAKAAVAHLGEVSIEELGGPTAPKVLLVAADAEEVLAAGAAHHEALVVLVAAREVDPAEVVAVGVAAVLVAVEPRLDAALYAVLVLT